MPEFVYVVASGKYDTYGVVDVYATLEAALAAYPGGHWTAYQNEGVTDEWTNGKDFDELREIRRYELKGRLVHAS